MPLLSHFTHSFICKLFATIALLLFMASSWAQNNPQTDLPRQSLTVGTHNVEVMVASEARELSIGLMWRTSMPINEGMLFIMPSTHIQCFWMKNTYLPLSTAFIAEDGTIINIVDMQPLSTKEHCSEKPARYVLEMNQGWFKEHGITSGIKISNEVMPQ